VQCAIRECLEETGIVAEITGFLGVYLNWSANTASNAHVRSPELTATASKLLAC